MSGTNHQPSVAYGRASAALNLCQINLENWLLLHRRRYEVVDALAVNPHLLQAIQTGLGRGLRKACERGMFDRVNYIRCSGPRQNIGKGLKSFDVASLRVTAGGVQEVEDGVPANK
nr:hypothetical protein [Mesorhizobium sp. CO1-1-4]